MPRTSPLRYDGKLIPLTRAAGEIFSGRVTSVHHIAPRRSGEIETVQVTFRVEHAIRGTHTGEQLTIREWAGLWRFGNRYREGEHVLLFLYPPSKLGLTSPVGGPEGRFAIDKNGQVTIGNLPLDESASAGNLSAKKAAEKKRVNLRDFAQAIRRLQEK